MKFLSNLKNLIGFNQLPREQRRLVFYSEGRTYWPHLKGIIKTILSTSQTQICYISSGQDDPGLSLSHPRYKTFKTDESWMRNWLFENIDTDIMVMTMPDLHQYQVKRSKHSVHYMYVQHSLVSLHMVYRKGAFDHYDTIFCGGPHHIEEMRAIETAHQLTPKTIFKHGYGRLDAIIEQAEKTEKSSPEKTKHILIAPSWGPNSIVETIGEPLVAQLLNDKYKVTLRPHPQTVKFSQNVLNDILQKHQKHPLFEYEVNVASQTSLHQSDLMISDWSGAALDYAFGLEKPVLFVDVPRKVNNPDYASLNIEPMEAKVRTIIGDVINTTELATINQNIQSLLKTDMRSAIKAAREQYVFNCTTSNITAADHITEMLSVLKRNQK